MHPWEFYEYSLSEYILRRKGRRKADNERHKEALIAAMIPYMKKEHRIKIVNEAFSDDNSRRMSLRERYEKIKQKYIDAGALKDGGQ
jgi:hypothetical protein